MAEDTDITSMLAGRLDARELGGDSKKADTDIWALIWSPDIGNVTQGVTCTWLPGNS